MLRSVSLTGAVMLGLIAAASASHAQTLTSQEAATAATFGTYATYSGIWFDKDSAWNSPIPSTAILTSLATTFTTKLPNQNATYPYYYGDNVVEAFIGTGKTWNNDWDAFTVAVIPTAGANSTDVLTNFTFTESNGTKWLLPNVPINPNVVAAIKYARSYGDTDDMMCIYDQSQNAFYAIWNAVVSADGTTISSIGTGAFFPMTGVGWSSTANGVSPSSGRISSASYCGGVIRPDEFAKAMAANTSLPHALAVAWPVSKTIGYNSTKPTSVAAPQSLFYSMATNTDGTSPDYNSGIHMGSP